MQERDKFKNFVIMRTDRIGEVLLSTVAVDSIRKAYPGARVTFVTSEYSRDIVEGREDVEEVITVDTANKDKWLLRSVRLSGLLRKKRFDTAIILNPHKLLHTACFLAGIARRVGYDRKWGFLLNKKVSDERARGEKHEIEYTMDLLRGLGIDTTAPDPRMVIDGAAEKFIKDLLGKMKIYPDRALIIIHPGSSNPAKMWPGKHYADLIRRIKSVLDCHIAMIGDETEKGLVKGVINEAGVDILDFSGMFDIKKLAAFLKKAGLFIGNDTGPMHMAAAIGVPVVAIFGRNIPGVSPVRWRPWGEKHAVLHESPGCDPCLDTACPYDYKCMRAVKVDAVLGAAMRILSKRQ